MTEEDAIFPERFALLKGPKISDDCPKSIRIGIWHAISRAVDANRIPSWSPVAKEILRLNRVQKFVPDNDAWEIASKALHDLRWDLVFVLCERVYGTLLVPEPDYDLNGNYSAAVPLVQVKRNFEEDVNQALAEDNCAFRMRQGKMYRPGRAHSQRMAAKAGSILQDPNLADARNHYVKATRYFSDVESRDLENCIKEATASLEATCRALFPELDSGLEKALREIRDEDGERLPPTVVKGILAPYHFRGAGKGIAHGDGSGGKPTARLAEWTLTVVAASIVLLKDLAESLDEDPPPF